MPLDTSLDDLLSEEITSLHLFCTAIAEEQALLVAGQVEGLPAATARKVEIAAQLSDLDARRNQLLVDKGFDAGRKGMENWVQEHPTSESKARWGKVLELASKAKTENEINGRLIGSKLQQNQQALSILLGDDGTAVTYGPNGQQAGIVGRRPRGHA